MFKLVHIVNLLITADPTVAALYFSYFRLFVSIVMYCNTH